MTVVLLLYCLLVLIIYRIGLSLFHTMVLKWLEQKVKVAGNPMIPD